MLMALLMNPSHSKDLGHYGHSFVITETNLLDVIYARLNALKASGALAKWQKEVVSQVKKSMVRPTGQKLLTTTTPDVFYHIPGFTLDRDITDHTGKLIYPKGLSVNALDAKSYPKEVQGFYPVPHFYQITWLFIDGDDASQVNWAKTQIAKYDAQNIAYKVILLQGNIPETNKTLNINCRFDMGGFLVAHLGIKAVPSVVTLAQENARLKITEIGAYQLTSEASNA